MTSKFCSKLYFLLFYCLKRNYSSMMIFKLDIFSLSRLFTVKHGYSEHACNESTLAAVIFIPHD